MAIDLEKEIRRVVETGKVELGAKTSMLLSLKGGANLILMSSNCPKDLKEEIEYNCKKSNTPLKEVPLTSLEVGSICGKPFPVTLLSVLDPGNSKILDLIESKEEPTKGEEEAKEEKEEKIPKTKVKKKTPEKTKE